MEIVFKNNWSKFYVIGAAIFWLLSAVLFVFATLEYPGRIHIYILFTLVCNTLFYFGFRKNAIFFDTFIGVFFWLGFWLKLSFRVAFMGRYFNQPVGNFNGSGADFDTALLVTSCGILGLLVVSFLREKFVFIYPRKYYEIKKEGLLKFYRDYRNIFIFGFVFLFATVAATNFYFGIYQRGAIPKIILPLGMSGIYKWLLLFGCASFAALMLHFEIILNRKTSYFVVILSLAEGFLTNVSLLSRGMVLNIGALAYGVIKSWQLEKIRPNIRLIIVSFLLFIFLFITSIFLVNHIRHTAKLDLKNFRENFADSNLSSRLLFLDRWVGIEGVMAVSSYPGKGWDLWKTAWNETFSYNKTTFYDLNLITSPYKNTDTSKYHYISLPGVLAFCFYPGSYPFLFFCMFIVGAIGAGIEISVFKIGGKNLILCALLSQVVAYRFAHFGYVPKQSYLLFGALYLNLFLIYFFNKILITWYSRKTRKFRTQISKKDEHLDTSTIAVK